MNIYSLSVLLFSFGVILIAILSLAKRRDHVSIRFSLFSISAGGWGILYSIWTSQNYSYETALWLVRISELFAVFIPITWTHFVLDFIGKKEPFPRFYLMNYIFTVFLALFCPTSYFFTGVKHVPMFSWYKVPGPIFYVFLSYFFILVPYAFYHLIQAYRTSVGQTKEQLKYIVIGWSIAFFAGSTTFLPVFDITVPLVFLLAMPLYPVFTGVALIRYGLFDSQQIADAFQREKLAAIGTLAASINHELRNPLFIAKGKIESHLDAIQHDLYKNLEEKDRNSQTVLNTALNHLSRAMDIMQKFSDFAKPFGGRNDREQVVLKEAFENVIHLVSNEFEMKKIKLNQVNTNGLSVMANRRQIEEIFFNLVLNSCQAMGECGGELDFDAYRKNGHIVVQLKDNGPGIPADTQRRIFEPFYSTKGEKGSGLGLYITKQLVERNSGKISVTSKIGQGTTFHLEFKR